MNLYNLIRITSARINESISEKYNKPLIRTYNEDIDLGVNFDFLFSNKNNVLSDLMTLSSIWNNVLPDDDPEYPQEVGAKQLEIAQWLVGIRNCNDMLILMKWLNKRCDVDSTLIYAEIELSS